MFIRSISVSLNMSLLISPAFTTPPRAPLPVYHRELVLRRAGRADTALAAAIEDSARWTVTKEIR